jgi:SAM-dependent methyltransferase
MMNAESAPEGLPQVLDRNTEEICRLCGNSRGIWRIHYPTFIFRSGDFEAPPWFAHDKFFCPECLFLWADVFRDLSLAEYGRKYVENNYDHQRRPTESRMAFAPWLLSRLIRFTLGQRFLDYGCGYNYSYIYELRSRGFDLWGCDISAAVNYSRYIRQLPFEDYPDNFFDGIFSIDVMEHLSDFDNDIGNMTRMLKPGGYMLHNTISIERQWPNRDVPSESPMLWAPWHCSIFSEKGAALLAEKVGLEYQGVMDTPSDTGMAFLFRKPGPRRLSRMNIVSVGYQVLRLAMYQRYYRKNYTKAPRI